MSGDDAGLPRELPLLLGAGREGAVETLLLLGAPVHGRVAMRCWSAKDWSGPPVSTTEDAARLLQWIETQAAAGRSLNQSLYGVRLWLRGEDADSRSR